MFEDTDYTTPSQFNLLKLSSINISLSLENKKPHLYKICSRLLWILVIFQMNYKINFMIFKIIRLQVMFFRKWHSISFGKLRANPKHKYLNRLFKCWYFHLQQHTSARAAFQLLYIPKRKDEIKRKLMMI